MKNIVKFTFLLLLLLVPLSLYANTSAQGWCEQGNRAVTLGGLTSTTKVQQSFPACTITVFLHNVTPATKATLYSNNAVTPTPLANPFTASSAGHWQWYAADGSYDVVMSGAGFPSPYTISDIVLTDGNLLTSLGAKCDGTTNDAAALGAAVTSLSGSGGMVVIPSGRTCIIGSNTSVASNVGLEFQQGSKFSISTGIILTVGGPVVASPSQIFSGLGRVSFTFSNGHITEVFPQWRGAVCDNSTNDSTAVQALIDDMESSTGAAVVHVLPGTCFMSDTRLTYMGSNYLTLKGDSMTSKFRWTVPATVTSCGTLPNTGVFNFGGIAYGTPNSNGILIEGMAFDFGYDFVGGGRTNPNTAACSAGGDNDKRGINIYETDNVRLLNNRFEKARFEMIACGNYANAGHPGDFLWVRGNFFTNFGHNGLTQNCNYSESMDNIFYDGYNGIEAGRDDMSIIGNQFNTLTSNGVKAASNQRFTIASNLFRNNATGATLSGVISIEGRGSTNPNIDGHVNNNTMVNASTYSNQWCVYVDQNTSTTPHNNIEISNNVCRGIYNGVGVNYGNEFNVNNNTFNAIQGNAVRYFSNANVSNNIANNNKCISCTGTTPYLDSNAFTSFNDNSLLNNFDEAHLGGGYLIGSSSVGKGQAGLTVSVSVTSGGVFAMDFYSGNFNDGILEVTDDNGEVCSFILQGGRAQTGEAWDPNNVCSVTKGTNPRTNVYWDAGNARYELQNLNNAGTRIYVLFFRMRI